ncbi:MAG: aminotransferase [Gammaproteobacteria bacterium TMED78]|nr:MAG: aminotransferase [Gammaproteobacteria bacterium TMED78]|tara:strand:+ start:20855 stop:22069 length:1215 start_codon:yes stop_codon:yes gene_type:complete
MNSSSQTRKDFPILERNINNKPLVYLDNAASTQRPLSVINAVSNYEMNYHSNVHRGVHKLSELSTNAFESSRNKIKNYINAESEREIIFTRGATESINIVASSFGQSFKSGDEIMVSQMEHHSNIVPWQNICKKNNLKLIMIPISKDGEIILDEFAKLLNSNTKLVAITHVSNALGTINPIKKMIHQAHEKGAVVIIDGAQAMSHMKIDVTELDCDFYAMSGHKMFAPTGIGALYGKEKLLDGMPPYQFGGEMILSVNFKETIYNELPYKFEAGTPNISGVIGLGAAIDYLNNLNFDDIKKYELNLLNYLSEKLLQISGLKIIGKPKNRSGVISFMFDNIHAHDIGTIVDKEGVAIRTGHHCAQPIMDFYEVSATARASIAHYNTKNDIDVLIEALNKVKEIFS